MKPVLCSYCKQPAELIEYPYGLKWSCEPCEAYVGCHEGTSKPLGTLADKELRKWRIKAHKALDKKWRNRRQRKRIYKKLAKHLELSKRDCHIGLFDVETCKKVIGVCSWYLTN